MCYVFNQYHVRHWPVRRKNPKPDYTQKSVQICCYSSVYCSDNTTMINPTIHGALMSHPYLFTKLISSYIALVVLIVSVPAQSSAQPMPRTPVTFEEPRLETRFLAGVSASGSWNSYSGGIPMVYSPICNHLENGSGVGYSGGVAFDYLLSRSLGLSFHAGYGSFPGSFQRLQPIGAVETGLEGEPGYLVIRIDSEIDYEVLRADLLLKWYPAYLGDNETRLGVAIGPSLALPIKGTMTQNHTVEVYSTDGGPLTHGDIASNQKKAIREKELAGDVEMERMRWQRYGVRSGMFLSLDMGSGVYVTPGFYMDLPLSNFSDFRWGSLSLYELQLDVMIGI